MVSFVSCYFDRENVNMALMHRSLFTWFMIQVFLILLALRLDEKVKWNWFIIFIPMWLFDGVASIFILVKMIIHCKSHHNTSDSTMKRKFFYMFSVFLKISFQTLMCIRLQYYEIVSLYFVMIPLWLLLATAIMDVLRSLLRIRWQTTDVEHAWKADLISWLKFFGKA